MAKGRENLSHTARNVTKNECVSDTGTMKGNAVMKGGKAVESKGESLINGTGKPICNGLRITERKTRRS